VLSMSGSMLRGRWLISVIKRPNFDPSPMAVDIVLSMNCRIDRSIDSTAMPATEIPFIFPPPFRFWRGPKMGTTSTASVKYITVTKDLSKFFCKITSISSAYRSTSRGRSRITEPPQRPLSCLKPLYPRPGCCLKYAVQRAVAA